MSRGPEDPVEHAEAERVAHCMSRAHRLYTQGDLTGAERAVHETVVPRAATLVMPEDAWQLMGEIRMRQQKYAEAIKWLSRVGGQQASAAVDLDLAVCYLRLGDYETALLLSTRHDILQFRDQVKPEDLPATDNVVSLTARVLLLRGFERSINNEGSQDALPDLLEANRLAPTNPVAAFFAGEALLSCNRGAEAHLFYKRAAKYARGKFAELVRTRYQE